MKGPSPCIACATLGPVALPLLAFTILNLNPKGSGCQASLKGIPQGSFSTGPPGWQLMAAAGLDGGLVDC